MPRPPGFTKQVAVRLSDEKAERCLIAGEGRGEVAGARLLLDLGWQTYSQAVGLAVASSADTLRAIAAEIDRTSSARTVAPSGALMVSEPTADKIHQQRTATGAALITMRNGVLLFGIGADEQETCFALDSEAGEIGITGGSARAVRQLGDTCPAVAALAQLLAGVLARTAETVSQGEPPTAAPAGRHERLGLTVWGAHPDDELARLQLGDAWLSCHSLALTALCSELFALQTRVVAEAIGQRQQLEAALSKAPSREAIALAWSRSHGE